MKTTGASRACWQNPFVLILALGLCLALPLGGAGCNGEMMLGPDGEELFDDDVEDNDDYDQSRQTMGHCPSGGAYAPQDRSFGSGIEGFASYDGQSSCSGAKPGVVAFKDFVLATYPCTRSGGIVRGCNVGGRSEHKEGRAWDWMVSTTNPAAERLLGWLLKKDKHGNAAANARRLGIMYMVWNRRIWRAYRASDGWQPYGGSNPHTDHVHFSFSWAGARKQTSFWGGGGPAPAPNPGSSHDPIGYLDSVSKSAVASGWACDRDNSSLSIPVHLYVGGPAGSGAKGYALTANRTHEQAVTSICKGGKRHRFVYQLPRDSCGKKVYAYGINTGPGNHALLTKSGMRIDCHSPIGYLDGITAGGRAWGWACDKDDPKRSIDVHIYVGGPAGSGAKGYSVKANIGHEAAVTWACGGGTAHRFSFQIPGGAVHGGKRIYAYGINVYGGVNKALTHSGRRMP